METSKSDTAALIVHLHSEHHLCASAVLTPSHLCETCRQTSLIVIPNVFVFLSKCKRSRLDISSTRFTKNVAKVTMPILPVTKCPRHASALHFPRRGHAFFSRTSCRETRLTLDIIYGLQYHHDGEIFLETLEREVWNSRDFKQSQASRNATNLKKA